MIEFFKDATADTESGLFEVENAGPVTFQVHNVPRGATVNAFCTLAGGESHFSRLFHGSGFYTFDLPAAAIVKVRLSDVPDGNAVKCSAFGSNLKNYVPTPPQQTAEPQQQAEPRTTRKRKKAESEASE